MPRGGAAMKQHVFLCKHCQHELELPRAGMRLQEVKSWFRYSRCPACKRELWVIEQVPEPVVPAATQQPLWTGTAPVLRCRTGSETEEEQRMQNPDTNTHQTHTTMKKIITPKIKMNTTPEQHQSLRQTQLA